MDIEVKGADVRLRHDRYTVNQPVKVTKPDGDSFEARSENVSRSGIALSLEGPAMENGQFLELHMEGLGNLKGRVVRAYSGGMALQFEKTLEQAPLTDPASQKVNKLA